MNHLDTLDRKNVNVLGEDDLSKVVGGRGRYWSHHGGGYKQGGSYKQGGGKQSGSSMRRRGGNDFGGDVTVNITINQTFNISVLQGPE